MIERKEKLFIDASDFYAFCSQNSNLAFKY